MKRTKIILAITCLIGLGACKDLGGSLTVHEKLTLKEGRSDVDVLPGVVPAHLKIQSKRKVNLVLSLPGREATIVIKTDKNLKDLRSGDRLQIPASTSGQPYDLDGVYQVTSSSTDDQRSVESCTYTVSEYSCWIEHTPQVCQTVNECDPNNASQCRQRTVCSGGESQQVCGNRTVTRSGLQEVEYHYTTTVESVRLSVLAADHRAAADFLGSDSDTNKIYTYQETCR